MPNAQRPTPEIPTRYDPKATEQRLYEKWESAGYFRADPRHSTRMGGEREPYVIVIPPPNVTAVLHMGHGLNNTIQDVLIRWQRMRGREALWIPGTDHAGIATQNVVERQLAAEGKTRQEVGREAFVERVWSWVDKTGGTILEQLRAIGSSCDWSRTAFTLDEGLSRAVREVFVRLYERDLVYRGNYIINWCPRCLTALSNEEAEPEETTGKIWRLRYPIADEQPGQGDRTRTGTRTRSLARLPDGRRYIVVATTRPETMLGDTAVAVHPEDERYVGLHGALVDLPLTGRRISIVADAYVDPEFGSGMVKVTPAHDPNDFEIGRRHDLPAIDVLTDEARMSDEAPEPFRGLDRFEARTRVVAAFEEAGLLEGVEEHTHSVPHCYRCGTIVEPRLSEQWFVRMQPLAEPALAASREGRVRFTPDRWKKVYEHWLENIRDWTISRQLWWGHRIPVWYCRDEACAEVIVAREDPTSCPKCGGSLEQDPDVLDTWFSSWLWPFSTMGWPDETPDLKAFYPTSALSTAPEILFFWVARMIMAGQEFMGRERTGEPMDGIPFQDVYLHGTVRDNMGRKMSKSLGNGIDPLEVVDLFGADALRFTLLAQAGVGTDILMNPSDLGETFSPGRNFANKLWNAGRFALMNMGEDDVARVDAATLELPDRWILSRAQAVVQAVDQQLTVFRFADAAESLRQFFWGEVADWYLELVKPRLYGDHGDASRDVARSSLVEVMDTTLRLMHPLVPFITEELWLRLPRPRDVVREESLVIAKWPEARPELVDRGAEQTMAALIEVVSTVRTLRAEYNVPAGDELEVFIGGATPDLAGAVVREGSAIRRLARIREASVTAEPLQTDGRAGAHAVLRSGADLFIPLEGIIDLERERTRLEEEMARIAGQIVATEKKLENRQFVERAPADVVEREREKAASFRDQRDRLAAKLEALR
ncbi:MAG TPA: valine--tRNA ligase [Longimicrobiales bacterium]|nr:valine--tRNA ligase [Longimicrobiales bacterium]